MSEYVHHKEMFEIEGFSEKIEIKIVADEHPINPRKEYDNVGTMVCWHRRYDLGDKNQPSSMGEMCRDLLDEYGLWNEVDLTKAVLDYGDEHDQYNFERVLGDDDRDAINEVFRVLGKHFVIYLLSLLDHSGLSIRIGSGAWVCDPGGWDSGFVGFIYAHHDKAEEWGGDIEQLKKCLQGEVETYDDYLTGNCWGYVVDDDGPDEDSCWGFLGDYEYCLEEARGVAKSILSERKATKDALKNNIWVNA